MSKLQWYWHRLRAMEPSEIAAHVQKRIYQRQDARRLPDWSGLKLEPRANSFPRLPEPQDAPAVLRDALARDTEEILAGRWKAFGHLELQVDDPPRWHQDYLVGKDLTTKDVAFKLNHRELPGGADIKLIWELSRWHQLVRLAMAAYVLNDERAAAKCVEWLEDWVKHNPPYRGWNWTSPLEVGMRLVQFTWIDALLRAQAEACGYSGKMVRLRHEILPAHVWHAWRYRSFGSSANNHLIGELVGLILTIVRWPELSALATSLDELQKLWQREVLAQFAEDGGNREQALNYHLFSWEFCWQARAALVAAGRRISSGVDERLRRAAQFYEGVQVPSEPWDFGDSDNAFVTPFFANEQTALIEWCDWFRAPEASPALEFWRSTEGGNAYPQIQQPGLVQDWRWFEDSGYVVRHVGDLTIRWDLSELGFLWTAAHGHLDALHVSIWGKGVAMVVDPGTGAYYADKNLRAWLASRGAHNAPCPLGQEWPRRLGPFLWECQHWPPHLDGKDGGIDERNIVGAELDLADHWIFRRIFLNERGTTLEIEDFCRQRRNKAPEQNQFTVRWQFAPSVIIERRDERRFVISRQSVEIEVQAGADWTEVKLVETPTDREKLEPGNPLAGIVSPSLRKTEFAPYLLLIARPRSDKPCVFRTTFLASHDS